MLSHPLLVLYRHTTCIFPSLMPHDLALLAIETLSVPNIRLILGQTSPWVIVSGVLERTGFAMLELMAHLDDSKGCIVQGI